MKRLFLNPKMGCIWQKDYANDAETTTDTANHIANICNAVRLHSTLDNLLPTAFAHQPAAQKPVEFFWNCLATTLVCEEAHAEMTMTAGAQ
jgi:hypothetical protein